MHHISLSLRWLGFSSPPPSPFTASSWRAGGHTVYSESELHRPTIIFALYPFFAVLVQMALITPSSIQPRTCLDPTLSRMTFAWFSDHRFPFPSHRFPLHFIIFLPFGVFLSPFNYQCSYHQIHFSHEQTIPSAMCYTNGLRA